VQVNSHLHASGSREAGSRPVLPRFADLAISHAFAAPRLLPMSDREKGIEIHALRHQLGLLQHQLVNARNCDLRTGRSWQRYSCS
jgi:hypothetical protein